MPGIFTDEPNISDVTLGSGLPFVPWTDGLADYFKARRGYDLLDVAPYLFFEGEGAAKARHDYWWTVSERFTEAYSAQLGAWCAAHGLALTGHFLEEDLFGNAIWYGGAVMPHYQHQQVPGIDMLRERTDEYLTVKQCTSVAHQFGRPFVLSETYGCTGWAFTFEGQKWVGDWQYVLGVTMRCQHLALYTLRGCRKRDYPPCFNYNTTWWQYNGVVEDYFARLGAVLTEGRAVRDVLVLHPVATGWMMVGGYGGLLSGGHRPATPPALAAANAYGVQLNEFAKAVLATHYDFDFGDEQIMARVGRVDGATLWVNEAPYRVVIIPPGTQTLLAHTVALLEDFLARGGQVIAFTPTPARVEAAPSARAAQLFARAGVTVLDDTSQIQAAVERAAPRRVSVATPHGQQASAFLAQQRLIADADGAGSKTALFVVNNDRDGAHRVTITLEGQGALEEWDPLTGEVRPVAATPRDGAVRFDATFGPAGARLYVLHHGAPAGRHAAPDAAPRRERVSYIGPVCAFTRTDPNVLTLDVCAYRVGEGAWSAPMPVWQAQQALRERLGMRQVYYNGLPQRYTWVGTPHPNDGAPVAFRFEFAVRAAPETPVYLLVENAEDFEIAFNGQPVASAPDGWYLDRSFDRVRLPALQPGRNTLTLACAYAERMEVEDCYLLGDFGVGVDRAIEAEPAALRFGDWCLQGYPHYTGSIVYHATYTHQPGARVTLRLGAYAATTVAVHVNGALAGHIPWRAANGLDVTPHLRAGENAIDIEVVSSPRNMLGSLHLKPGDEAWTDWRSFRSEGERYTPEYMLVPYGLMGQVALVASLPGDAQA
ncbi:MAG: glycosyl hydrolase [Anaerolineae bacterium]|nr:glycosyl hydrolase [Anaerolineae bacterium]